MIATVLTLLASAVVAVVAWRCCDRMSFASFDDPALVNRLARAIKRISHPVRVFYVAICATHAWVVLRVLFDGYRPSIEHAVCVCAIAGLLLGTRRKVWPRRAGLDADANQVPVMRGRML